SPAREHRPLRAGRDRDRARQLLPSGRALARWDPMVTRRHQRCRRGSPVRPPGPLDDYGGLTGEVAEAVRRAGIRSTVGIPLVVAGGLLGAVVVSPTEPDPLHEDTEARLTNFTELVATAIANAEARERVERLAEEQAALRRVATLVAHGARPGEVFSAVSDEVARLIGCEAAIISFEPDGSGFVIARVSDGFRG